MEIRKTTNTGYVTGGNAGGGRRAGFFSRLKRGAVKVAAKVVARVTEKMIDRLDPDSQTRAELRTELRGERRARVIERRATGTRGPARKRRRPSKLARTMQTSFGVRNTASFNA